MLSEKRGNEFGLIFWAHLIVILLWYAAPFLFSWYWLLVGVAFSYLQGLVFKGCLLTHAQFGKEAGLTFWGHYLGKLGLRIEKSTAKLLFFWIEPLAVLLIAIAVQAVFGFEPLLF